MKDIKCGLKTCKHNKGYCCCARQIDVTGGACCQTFAPDANKNKSLFEAGSDFVKANYSTDTKVGCNAPCVFNKDSKCVANGITVMTDESSSPSCLTFLKE